MLSDLRIFTRARICYALTAAKVCGAVAQTNVFDYRREDGLGHAHFGLPLSSVEVKLVNKDDQAVGGTMPEGEIVVSGPAVVGQQVNLGIKARFREDGTLQLIS
jgi:acyl-CoA synthetase (AMP-forming)/AMP-acid ligase II